MEFTVCTPTYNRAHMLNRPFNSLLNQTFKNFEWIIVDDGSTDNTKEIVNELIKRASFPIKYIYQDNKGRAGALNTSYDYIESKYVVNLDSDDELLPDALYKMHMIWKSIPQNDYARFGCITGHCINLEGKRLGADWPDGINELTGKKQRRKIFKYRTDEKSNCYKFEILKKYPFPQFDDTKFVSEVLVWDQIRRVYDEYCVNENFRVYYEDSPDSLSGRMDKEALTTGYYTSLFYLNECISEISYNTHVVKSFFNVNKWGIRAGKNLKTTLYDINKLYKKFIILLTRPIMLLYCFYKHF